MNDLTIRIIELRTKLDYSQGVFASENDIEAPQQGKFERGENQPSFKYLISIVNKYGVSWDWLMEGKGEPFKDEKLNVGLKVGLPGKDPLQAIADSLGKIVVLLENKIPLK